MCVCVFFALSLFLSFCLTGKTTFLRTLLGKVTPTSGSVTVNTHYSVSDLRIQTGFVPQDDTMLNMLTVRQLLNYSAYSRLPAELSHAEKLQRVEETLQLLHLTHIADVVVGDDVNRGVSGGEKKRVSIAMEMVADPLLLFLDGMLAMTTKHNRSTAELMSLYYNDHR